MEGWRASCEEKYSTALMKLSKIEVVWPKTAPAPLNSSRNVGVQGDGKIVFRKPTSGEGG